MKKFAIFGASGFGREVMPLARFQLLKTESEPFDLVFVDDKPIVAKLNGHRVLTFAQWLLEPADSRHISLAVANSLVREKLAMRCIEHGVKFYDVKASNAVVLDDVKTGAGLVLASFSNLTSNILIGKHFHANIYSYVAHDCVIGDYVTFAPGVQCNGNVVIEDHAYIGTGAVIKQGKPGQPLIIGQNAVVGMGAVVTRDVLAGTTVIGNPAKNFNRS